MKQKPLIGSNSWQALFHNYATIIQSKCISCGAGHNPQGRQPILPKAIDGDLGNTSPDNIIPLCLKCIRLYEKVLDWRQPPLFNLPSWLSSIHERMRAKSEPF